MSVRNILDGTIPVGGSIGPGLLEEVQTESLTVCPPGMLCTGPMTCANTATIDKVNVITGITTPSLKIEGTKVVSPSLILEGEQVLNKEYLNDTISFKGLKADGATAANFSQAIERWMYNIHPKLHILVMSFGVTTEPLSQLIIPTGLTCEKGANCWQRTLLKTNTNEYLDATVVMGEDGGKLSLKLFIPTGSTYTSFQARIVTPFY